MSATCPPAWSAAAAVDLNAPGPSLTDAAALAEVDGSFKTWPLLSPKTKPDKMSPEPVANVAVQALARSA